MNFRKLLKGRNFKFTLFSREVGGKRRADRKKWEKTNDFIRNGGCTAEQPKQDEPADK